jgi:hypothetical protein
MRTILSKFCAHLALILLVSPVYAQDRLPPLSGGIGESGREIIQQNQPNYPLKLVLVGEAGVFLSDVNVSITNAFGEEVTKTVTEGPILLVDLAPGNYTVTATTEGLEQIAKITVNATGLKTYHLRFPIKD